MVMDEQRHNTQVRRVMGARWIRVLGHLLLLNLVGIERRRRDMGKGVGVLLCDSCYKRLDVLDVLERIMNA